MYHKDQKTQFSTSLLGVQKNDRQDHKQEQEVNYGSEAKDEAKAGRDEHDTLLLHLKNNNNLQ